MHCQAVNCLCNIACIYHYAWFCNWSHTDPLILSSSPMQLNESICPNISLYTFHCKLYRNFSQLTWVFEPDVNNIIADANKSSCNTDQNYSHTFFTSHDLISSTTTSTCETAGYNLTAVVTRDMGQMTDCSDPYYAASLKVQRLTSDRIPFSVSCSADSTMLTYTTMTTHHGFIGKFNLLMCIHNNYRTAFYNL